MKAMTVCPVVAFTLLYRVDSLITISLAKDFIAGWDFYKSAREGRTADFAAADNDVDQLILRDADGNTYAWLDKSNSAGGYEGKNAAVNWTSKKTKALGETYWQTKVNATAFTDIKVKSSMLYNYNAYETYNVEYSLNGTDWKLSPYFRPLQIPAAMA